MSVQIGINPLTWTNDDMPELGGDTDAILGELGISGDEVARLRADGVV